MESSKATTDLEVQLTELEKRLEKRDPQLADVLLPLASNYAQSKNYYKAETTYWRAIEVLQQAQETRSAQLISSLEELAHIYDEQMRELEADRLRQWITTISPAQSQTPEPSAKNQSILTMPISELFKQAGVVLTTPIGDTGKKDTQRDTAGQVTQNELSVDLNAISSQNVLKRGFLKQANDFLNTPLSIGPKAQEKPAESSSAPDQSPSANANSTIDNNTATRSGTFPAVNPNSTATPSGTFPVAKADNTHKSDEGESLYLRWKREQEDLDSPFACPHGQSLGVSLQGCMLCKAAEDRKNDPEQEAKRPDSQKPLSALLMESSGHRFPLRGATLWIGPSDKSDICLKTDAVPASYQATISGDDDGYWFTELSEEPRAKVNGKTPKGKSRLYCGDVIAIAGINLRAE